MKAAFFWSFAGQYIAVATRAVSVIVIARLLTPSEIGAFAIAAAILALGHAFRNFGLAQYLVREENLTKEKKEATLLISWISSILLSTILVFSATTISEFYQSQQITVLLSVLAINILFIPLGLLAENSLVRGMQFKRLSVVMSANSLVNLIVSISLALLDFGALSLALAALAGQITSVICFRLLATPSPIKYKPNYKGLIKILPSISLIGGANIINILGQHGQPLIIGKALGEESVAFYDKGYAVIQLLNQLVFESIQRVLLPLFSSQKKIGVDYEKSYLEITSITLAIAWPFLFFLYFFADLIIPTLYGNQWNTAIELIPYICIGAAISNIARYHNELLISIKQEKKVFKTNLIVIIISLTLAISFAHKGLVILVAILQIQAIIRLILTTKNITQLTNIKASHLLQIIKQNLFIATMAILPIFILNNLTNLSSGELFIVSVPIAFLCWLIALEITKHSIRITNLYKIFSTGR